MVLRRSVALPRTVERVRLLVELLLDILPRSSHLSSSLFSLTRHSTARLHSDTPLRRRLGTILVRLVDSVARLDSLRRRRGSIGQVEDKLRVQDTLPRVRWLLIRPRLLVSPPL